MPSTQASRKTADVNVLIERIATDHPDFTFVEDSRFSWHAGHKRVSFKKTALNSEHGVWTVLHELGHALLNHTDYRYDIELLQMEAAAWARAHELAAGYGVQINEDHVQDCLDTYRDWLHLRATCPACYGRSLQASVRSYHCHNCGSEWQVSRSRLCRPYRLQVPEH